jgi:hypothetical protein
MNPGNLAKWQLLINQQYFLERLRRLDQQLYRWRNHKEQYRLWLSGGFEEFDISLS